MSLDEARQPDHAAVSVICQTGDFEVYRALSPGREQVLLKVPAPACQPDEAIPQLQRELEIARELDPAFAVRPLRIERAAGHMALVLEDFACHALSEDLTAPLDLGQFLKIAIGATGALAALHRQGVVHKDIKPENIFLDSGGPDGAIQVKLTGFGVALRLSRERQAPGPPEAIAGTLAYMAPEQTGRMNRSVDSRSDLYALGVTFYQMLTGRLPFSASDPMEWVHCHIALQPPPPSQRRAAIPEPLSDIVMKLLAKNAEDRYQTAEGLKADLVRCAAEWREFGRIAPFPLGAHDIADRLVIPEKLYGREREVGTLLDAFDRVVASGAAELVLVSGYSGVGKTSVVHELHMALVPPRGLFAAGKFDQYKRDIPYATLVQALQTLMRHILGKGEAELAAWRDAIQAAVNANGQLIINLIPEVELIIGRQPPVPELGPQESLNRFQMVLRRFLGVFARPEHPLVLFLDDLQWLDSATLELIEQLAAGQEVRHLLLIGAYRDNEVGPTHPLMRIIEAIRKRSPGLREIVLAPLGIGDVGSLVADSLHCDRARALPLAQLVQEKTGGNPFFAIQFLTALAEEKLVVFDPDIGRWTWDLARIHAKGYTDNVVDLMVGKVGRLPAATLEALEQFACLGNVADIATLAAVRGLSEEALRTALSEAERAGLVFRQEKTYAFLHDRVQEAAYALVPETRRKALHLKIGRLLLAQHPQEALAERVFEVVDQFNRSVELVTDATEREALRRLNAAAGRKARDAVAYASGRRYLDQAMAFLPPAPWNECYAESIALSLDLAECEYLVGNFQRSDELLTAALEKACSTLDLTAIQRLRLRLYQISGRYREAVEAAFVALRIFGVTFPAAGEDARAATEAEHRLVSDNVRGRRILDLCDIPPADDAETRALIALLAEAIPLIYLVRPELWPLFTAKAVNICLQRGHGGESSFLYSCYAVVLAGNISNILTAEQFSEMAIKLSAQTHGAGPVRGRVLLNHSTSIIIWRHRIATSLPLMEQAFRACLDFGDLIYAGYLTLLASWLHLENGDPLERMVEMVRRHVAFARESHNDIVYRLDRVIEQFALSLQGKTRSLTDFSDAAFDEAASVAAIEQSGYGLAIAYHRIMKQIVAFIDEQYDEALEWANRAGSMLLYVRAHATEVTHYFYHALTLAALHAEAPAEQQRQLTQTIGEMLPKLKLWADNCPENFANRYFLVSAELARIEGRDMEAMRLYDQAIRSARDNNFVHHEALAAEVASRFYRARGFDRIADAYLRDARASYARWGAQGKVRQMEQRYPQLRETPSAAPAATFPAGAQELDILAAVRASQAVSGEIPLDSLLKILMRIVLENAGARQGCLLLVRNEGLTPAAVARVENQKVAVHLQGDPEFRETGLPASILNYVRRSRDKVLLDDATRPNPYSGDEYFSRQHPRSVLCFPIVRQTSLIGLLYLENDLATHAFTPERLAVLELFAAQAAISLENALVYEALQESEAKYRRIVNTAAEGIWMLNAGGMTVFVNAKMAEMLGYAAEEMLGRPLTDFMFEEDASGQPPMMERRRHGISEKFERRFRHRDGHTVWTIVSATPVFDEQGGFKGAFGMHTDITERRRTEDDLRLMNERFALATTAARIGVWDWYIESGKLVWDDGMYKLYGIRREDFADAYDAWLKCVHPDDRAFARARAHEAITLAAKRGEREYDVEFRVVWPSGAIHYIKAYGQITRDAQGKPLRMTGVNFDVTGRRLAEEELRRYKDQLEETVERRTAELVLARDAAEAANMAKSAFLANMSHELRTPMNAILGFSSLMRREPEVTERQRKSLEIINRSGEHLLTLINDVLDIAKIEAGRTQLTIAPFDLGAMVRDVADMMRFRAEEKGLQLLLDQSSEFPRFIKGDEARLRQVLVNLTGNAVKFTQVGGVTIRLGVKQNARDHLLMEVEDTGPGIKPEDRKRLFKPFEQLTESGAQKGTGLGLAISRQFVELMGGGIGVESTVGKGSVFRVELPVELPGEAETCAQPHETQAGEVCGLAPGTPSYRILIAEDHPENRMLLVNLMIAIGLYPKVAENGEQAVKIFEEWRPHLIWMDRRMPVMDGIEATRRIRELPGGQDVKIVAVTASAFKEQQQELFDVGMDDFVLKPYRFDEIYGYLARQLGVKYLYRSAAPGAVAAEPVALTPAMLASLPTDLREELKAALESLDTEQIAAAIQKATEFDAGLGHTLERLAGNFDYPAILNALDAESH